MSAYPFRLVMSHLRRLVGGTRREDVSDVELLSRFVACRDENAFSAILERHGHTVFNICLRVLQHPHDAEDAFQGTFLLLAQRARSIKSHDSIAGWLYKVAHRLSLGLRTRLAARRSAELRAGGVRGNDPGMRAAWDELQDALNEELDRLPPRFQAPVLMCHVQGLSHEEVSRRLGCPVGTVNSRLARGRIMLRKRLEARGLTLPAAGVAVVIAVHRVGAAPALLMANTRTAALALAGGQAIPEGLVSADALEMVRNTSAAFGGSHVKIVLAVLLAVGVLAAGTGTILSGVLSGKANTVPPANDVAGNDITPVKARAPDLRVDQNGDTLPAAAMARIGTRRFWAGRDPKEDFRCTLTFTPDSKHVALAAPDRSVLVWDALTGKETAHVGGVVDPANYIPPPVFTFSPDGKLVAVIEAEAVRVWDIKENKQVAKLKIGWGGAKKCVFSPNGKILVAVGYYSAPNGSMARWDTTSWKELPAPAEPNRSFNDCAFSADSRLMVAGGDDQHVCLMDADTGKMLKSYLKHRERVMSVAISADGKRLASRGGDSIIHVWDAKSGEDIHSWRYPTHYVGGSYPANTVFLRFGADAKTLIVGDTGIYDHPVDEEDMIASAGTDHGIRTFDVATGKELHRFKGPQSNMSTVLSPDGKLAAVVGYGCWVRVFDSAANKELTPFAAHEGAVLSVAFSPDNRVLATGGLDRTIRLWNVADGAPSKTLIGHTGPVTQLRFSPEGAHLASASNGKPPTDSKSRLSIDRNVSWWDASTGKELRQFPCHDFGVAAIGVSADGKQVVTIASGGLRHVWNAETATIVKSVGDLGVVQAVSTDCRFVAYLETKKDDKPVPLPLLAVFDAARQGEGDCVRQLQVQNEWPRPLPLAVSPSGQTVVTAKTPTRGQNVYPVHDWVIQLWDVSTGKLSANFETKEGPENWNLVGAFSPDSRTLALGYRGGIIALIDVATGKERGRFRGEQAAITSLAFSADGKLLASGSEDGTALVWDMKLAAPPAVTSAN